MLIPTSRSVAQQTREGPAMSTISAMHSQFSEAREAARRRWLAVFATSFGIVAVTVASAAAIVVTVGA